MKICMEKEYSLSKNTDTVVSYWRMTGYYLVHLMQFKSLHKIYIGIMQRRVCTCVCEREKERERREREERSRQ